MRARDSIALLALFACACNEAFADRIRIRSMRGRDTVLSVPDTEAPTDGTAIVFTVAATSITLDWGDASDVGGSGVDHYEVRMTASSQTSPANCNTGSTVTGCSDPTVSNCTATGLTTRTSYAFIVCAVDVAGNMSTGLTGWEQPYSDTLAIHFGDDSGTPVTNEFLSAADNAIFECDSNDQLTVVVSYYVDTCVDGANCDDFILAKGPNTNITWDILAEFGAPAGNFRPRNAYGALAQWAQTNIIRSDGTAGVGATDRWTRQANTYAGAGGDNDARVDIFARQCDGSSPPSCTAATTDMTAGLGACGTAPCFFGTIAADLGDDATSFFVAGVDTTSNFNLLGYINEAAGFCNGKVTASCINNCIFDGTTAKFLNLGTLSKRTCDNGAGTVACDTVFTNRQWWYSFGDGESTCAADTVALTNWFNPGTGNLADTNVECADIVSHSL